jgi:sugar lactone lactonase YvrE
VLCNPGYEGTIRRSLGPGYTGQRLPLRAWWLMEQQQPTVGEVVRYAVTRRPWGVVGSSDFVVLRRSEESVEWLRDAPPPARLAAELPITSARITGKGWLAEPRGLAVRDDGTLAVADVVLSTVVLLDPDGAPVRLPVPLELRQPEDVAWTPDGLLVVADTWAHRLLLYELDTGAMRPLPPAPEGWYGPRGVAAAPDGTIVATDTGNKRLVFVSTRRGVAESRVVGRSGGAAGEFVEPVGVAWLDDRRLVVCDTGNHRLQELNRDGSVNRIVELPGAWVDFYSRPQIAVITPELWVVSDTPASAIWIIRSGRPQRVPLADDGIVPTGVAFDGTTLYLADLGGRVWQLDLDLNSLG